MPTENKNKIYQQSHSQKGFTVIELGVVLLAIAILTVGVVKIVGPMIGDSKAHNMSNALSILAVNTTKLSLSGGYGLNTDLIPVLITSDKIPSEFTVSGGVVSHKLDGVITATGKGQLYSLNVTGLTQPDCMGLVSSSSSGYERVIVDSTATAPASVTVGGSTPPITPTQGATLCSSLTGNVIHFVSR